MVIVMNFWLSFVEESLVLDLQFAVGLLPVIPVFKKLLVLLTEALDDIVFLHLMWINL
jgi:hypothetical protein